MYNHTQKVAKCVYFFQCVGSLVGVHGAMTPSKAENTTELHDSISGLKHDHKA